MNRPKPPKSEFDPNAVLRQLVRNEPDAASHLNELVEYFYNDGDLSKLEELLTHNDPSVVASGAYILDELGPKCRPLLKRAGALIASSSYEVRMYALGAILAASTREDVAIVSKALDCVSDDEVRVRSKMIDFLARIDVALLDEAIKIHPNEEVRRTHLPGLVLLSTHFPPTMSDLRTAITSQEAVLAAYALAGAVKLLRGSAEIVKVGSRSMDPALQFEADIVRKSYNF